MLATQLTSLESVLTYRHPGVVRRYCKDYGASPAEAAELFDEMLKWLYLCYRASTSEAEGFGCIVSSEIEKIDRMWHTFLLFTWDYTEFCFQHFGVFLHHFPNEAENETPVADDNTLGAILERQFRLVYDVLGEETLRAWYDQERYAA